MTDLFGEAWGRHQPTLLRIGALLAASGSLLSVAIPALAAAPVIDTTVPTTTYSAPCMAGLSNASPCLSDNAGASYYMDSSGEYELESSDRADVEAAIARYETTDLSVTYDSTPTFSGSGETDIIYQEGSFGYPESVIGITWCNDPVDGSTHRCDQSYIRIRGAGAITEISAGHETGHSFGLMHGAQSAPVQGQCDSEMGIMRANTTCSTSAALGATIVANLNWNY